MINKKYLEMQRLKKKYEKPLYEILTLKTIDWQTKLSYVVSDVLEAVHRGRKRYQRKRRQEENWWSRNSERLWTITEGICKIILKVF